MASSVQVRTRALTRDQIAEFIRTPRGIRAFEDLTADAAKTLPAAAQQAQETADAAQQVAGYAQAAALAAADAVDRLDRAMQMLQVQSGEIAALREDLAAATRRIDGLAQGTTP